ncbi:MAG: tetratricopeptide repeat protein [Oscillospiraceae bacterium]|nr:tetratricopeptide repeat protein [Oscillospiraceae bacterium]
MQKKSKIIIISIVSALILLLGVVTAIALTGKGSDTEKIATEKLSLGQKFLLDLEYDKAVAEFQAVIDIEPKNVDAYMGLASAYIGMGDEEKAIETLEKGFMETGDDKIKKKLDEMKKPEETTAGVTTTPEETTTPETTTTPEVTTIVAETTAPETTTVATTTAPKVARTKRFDYDDGRYAIIEYNSKGDHMRGFFYNSNGVLYEYYIYEYDSKGNLVEEIFYNGDGTLKERWINEYGIDGKRKKSSHYNSEEKLDGYDIIAYDPNGNEVRFIYDADGTLLDTHTY